MSVSHRQTHVQPPTHTHVESTNGVVEETATQTVGRCPQRLVTGLSSVYGLVGVNSKRGVRSKRVTETTEIRHVASAVSGLVVPLLKDKKNQLGDPALACVCVCVRARAHVCVCVSMYG